jgi:polyisoprenoid-binding protein YceI
MTTEAGRISQAGAEVAALARNGALAGRWTLDPQASRAEFRVPHFWGVITVRGRFERLDGEGSVAPDGRVTGRLVIDAASLTTQNKQRDKHLRSADFFHVEQHPQVVLTVGRASLTDDGRLAGEGVLAAAGVAEPVSFTADVVQASPDAVTLRAELTVDRSRYGMTWSPMRMAALQATGSVTARFTREPGDPSANGTTT